MAPWVAAGAILALLAVAALAWSVPRLSQVIRRRREAHRASEAFAYDQAISALRSREFGKAAAAIDLWSKRMPPAAAGDRAGLSDSLTRLGASLYGLDAGPIPEDLWRETVSALRAARQERLVAKAAGRAGNALPPLNPGPIS